MKKTLLSMSLAFALAQNAWGLGLGQAKVLSALGQPLHIQVSLSDGSRAAAEEAKVSLGSIADFDRLSMAYKAELMRLRSEIILTEQGWVVDIRSHRPFNDPFVEFPLRLRHRGLQVVRGITVLLDPPNFAVPAQVSASSLQGTSAPVAAPSATPPAAAPTSSVVNQITVQAGDTLWPLAARFKPRNASTEQMMMALLKRNPDAFINGNINQLRSGAVMALPNTAELNALDPRQARRAFREQMRQWKTPPVVKMPSAPAPAPLVADAPAPQAPPASEQAPIETPPTSSPATSPETVAETKAPEPATAATAEPNTPADAESELRVLKADDAATTGAVQNQVLLNREEAERQRLEQQALSQQVQEMRAEMDKMFRLLQLKDDQIQALKATVDAGAASTTPANAEDEPKTSSETAAPAPAQLPALATSESATALPQATAPLVAPVAQPVVAQDDALSSLRELSPWWLLGLLALPLGWLLLRRKEDSDELLGQHPEFAANPNDNAGLRVIADSEATLSGASPLSSTTDMPLESEPQAASLASADQATPMDDLPEFSDHDLAALSEELDIDLAAIQEIDVNEPNQEAGIDAFWSEFEAEQNKKANRDS